LDDEAFLRARLRELAVQRRCFGHRRLYILILREGFLMNHKKVRRLYRALVKLPAVPAA
jgi:putative transposase